MTAESLWHHCPGKDNSVDLFTRYVSVVFLMSIPNWWTGPAFLKETIEEIAEPGIRKDEYISEVKKKKTCDNSDILVTLNATTDYKLLNFLSNDFVYILCVLSFLFKFIYNVKNLSQKKVGYRTDVKLT